MEEPSPSAASLPPRPSLPPNKHSLPPKPPSLPPQRSSVIPAVVPSAVQPATGGGVKLIVAFLVLLSLGNLALTIYYNQPKDGAPDFPGMAGKIQAQQEEITALQQKVESLQGKLTESAKELSRLKVDHVGLSTRVGSISTPTPLPYLRTEPKAEEGGALK